MGGYFEQLKYFLDKLNWKAIFSGIIVDFFLSLIVIPIGFVFFEVSDEHRYFHQLALIFGLASVAVGGYVTAYLSLSSKVINTTVFGVLMALIGVTISIFVPVPIFFNVISTMLVVPVALFGWLTSKYTQK